MEDILDPLYNATITFYTNGGTPVAPIKVEKGTAIDEPVTTKEGLYFNGWHSNWRLNDRIAFPYIVRDDAILHAAWTDTPPDTKSFIAVTGITGAPETINAGTPLTLNGTVTPSDATNQTIVWSVNSAGTTGASITGNTLNVTAEGTVIVTATVADGAAVGTDYTQNFTITVNNLVNARQPDITVQPAGASYFTNGTAAALTVTASSPDGGNLTYQWYSNTTNSSTGGSAIDGATNASYTPLTTTAGTAYYYVIVTNTIADNGDGGNKTASAASNAAAITVTQTAYSISLSASGLSGGSYTFPSAITGYGEQTALTVTVVNNGNQPTGALTVELSGVNAGSFALSATSLASINQSGTPTFTVTPNTGLAVGTYTAFVTVSGGNGISQSFNVSFTVNAAPSYGITLSQTGIHTFPTATAGYGAQTPMTVTVTNTGNQPTGALTAAISGANAGGFALSTTSIASIAANGNANFTVTPNTGLAAGTYTATVTVSGGADITAQSFNVSFNVNNLVNAQQPNITVHPANANYYTNGTAAALTVTAGVTDGGALTYQWYSNSTNSNTGGSAIGGATNANYTPPITTEGTAYYYAIVTNTITDNGDGGNKTAAAISNAAAITVTQTAYSISLGNGTTPITGTTHTFTAETEGYTTPPSLTVTVSNTGNQPTGALTAALSGTNAGDFELSTTSLAGINPGGTTALFTVSPNTGLAVGTYTAIVTVSGGANITAQSFNVSFTVNAAPTYGISLSQTSAHTFSAATEGYTTPPSLTVTVSNTGNQQTGGLTVALSGTNAASFALSATSLANIAANGNTTFTVSPRNNLDAGTYTATVTVSGGVNITAQSFNVSFTVNNLVNAQQPVITLQPQGASYFTNGTAAALTVTAGVTDGGTLTYQWYSNSTNSNTGGTTDITNISDGASASFTPIVDAWYVWGTLYYYCVVTNTITDNGDGGQKTATTASNAVAVTVTEAAYGISLSPTSHTFPPATAGYGAQTPLTVTVNNAGNQPTGDLTAALSGTNASDFELSTTSITNIAAGYYNTFTVTPLTGLDEGTYNATVTVSGGANITARSFTVSFTVNPEPIYSISLFNGATELTADTTHTFPTATVGYGAQTPLTVTVTNTGNMPTGTLNISGYSEPSSGFNLPGSVASIDVGESRTFTVSPRNNLAAGTYNTRVMLSGTNPNFTNSVAFNVSFTVNPEPTYSIELLNGTTPIGTTHTYTAQTVGYITPSSLAVTVSNTGNQPTGALTAALSGTNAGSFNLDGTSIASIAVDGSPRNFTVTPITGLAAGTHTATVTVSNTANGISESFNVSFTVNKLNPTVNWPTGLTAAFNSTWNSLLTSFNNGDGTPGNFSWTNGGTSSVPGVASPTGKTSNLTFTPNDTATYNIVNQDITITVTPASVSNQTIILGGSSSYAPAKNTAPTPLIQTGTNYDPDVTWSSSAGVLSGNFGANTVYTVTLTLTAANNYTFPAGFSATINSQTATEVNNPNPGGHRNVVTVSLTFPATERAVINMTIQPAEVTTVTAGDINASISAGASIDVGATLSYQWYSNATASNTGGTPVATNGAMSTFYIPTTLTAGTYYYYCVASGTLGAEDKTSNVATVHVQQSATFNITYTHITDGAPTIAGLDNPITISRGATTPQTYTINLPAGVTYDSIQWSIPGTTVTGSSNSFELNATNTAYNAVGVDRELLLRVEIDGVPYSKSIPFRVTQ